MTYIGWLATVLLSLSGVPFAWRTYQEGSTDMPLKGILLILLGMVLLFIYEAGTSAKVPQLVDFALSAACWSVVLTYKIFPRNV